MPQDTGCYYSNYMPCTQYLHSSGFCWVCSRHFWAGTYSPSMKAAQRNTGADAHHTFLKNNCIFPRSFIFYSEMKKNSTQILKLSCDPRGEQLYKSLLCSSAENVKYFSLGIIFEGARCNELCGRRLFHPKTQLINFIIHN